MRRGSSIAETLLCARHCTEVHYLIDKVSTFAISLIEKDIKARSCLSKDIVLLGLNPGGLTPKPVWSTWERGRKETVSYPDVLCLPGTVRPKGNRGNKLGISSNT